MLPYTVNVANCNPRVRNGLENLQCKAHRPLFSGQWQASTKQCLATNKALLMDLFSTFQELECQRLGNTKPFKII